MSIQGGVPVGGFMSTTDPKDTYAVTKEEYHQGGFRSVNTIEDMNAITEERRKEGMLVYVLQDSTNNGKGRTYRYLNNKFVVDEVTVDGFATVEDLANAKREIRNDLNEYKTTTNEELRDHEERITNLEEGQSIKLDDEMLEFNVEGKLTVKPATSQTKGVIKVDNDTVFMEDDVLKTKVYKADNVTIVKNTGDEFSVSKDITDAIADLYSKIEGVPDKPSEIGYATALKAGIVRPDNDTIQVDTNGVISIKNVTSIATTAKAGIVKPDGDTLTILSDGTIKIRNPIKKLGQIGDVITGNISTKAGQVLTVNDKGTGFVLKQPGSAINRSKEFEVDSEKSFSLIFDFNPYVNTAVSAMLECKPSSGSTLELRYVAITGGEYIETVNETLVRYLFSREMHVTLYAKGKGKIYIDMLTLI